MSSPPAMCAVLTAKLNEMRAARYGTEEKSEEALTTARTNWIAAWIDNKCRLFNQYMTDNNLKACCVSLSGGVDSALTLGLMQRAASMENSPIERLIAISQPIRSSAWAFERAQETVQTLNGNDSSNRVNIDFFTIDQTELYGNLKTLIDGRVGVEGGKFAGGQLRSYMRTPCAYYVAQLISQQGQPCIVMGTGNKDEDGYLAYFCKAGDGVVDVQLIADLHKSEVFEAARVLGVPASVVNAAPSADLWDDQTDEDELGFTYDFIELWTNILEKSEEEQQAFRDELAGAGDDGESAKQWEDWGRLAVGIHERNRHKLNSPVNL